MSETTLAAVEMALGVQLPAKYIAAVDKLAKLSDPAGLLQMIVDPERLLAINLDIRKSPKKYVKSPASLATSWPATYFVIADRGVLCFIDTRAKNPEVFYLRDKKLVEKNHLTPSGYASVTAFAKMCETSWQLRMKSATRLEEVKRDRQAATRRKPSFVECPDLVGEGMALAKPCVLLGTLGSKTIGIKGGQTIGDPPKKAIEHLLTISCAALLEPGRLTGLISIYKVDDDAMFKAMHYPDARLPSRTSGTRLFGKQHLCLPPFGVLVHKGSAKVKHWFQSLCVAGRDAEAWAEANQHGKYHEVGRYLTEFRSKHPFYRYQRAEYEVMLGGWTIDYPGGSDWYETMNKQLVLLTLQGEPWLEVTNAGKQPKLTCHIT